MVSHLEPRFVAALVGVVVGSVVVGLALWRARWSRYPALLWTCAAYMALLSLVWIVGLLTSPLFDAGFGTLELLTFPWSLVVNFNMQLAGFGTLHDLLLNYARFVLGFGGLQCLALTLFVWELRLRPRRRVR